MDIGLQLPFAGEARQRPGFPARAVVLDTLDAAGGKYEEAAIAESGSGGFISLEASSDGLAISRVLSLAVAHNHCRRR